MESRLGREALTEIQISEVKCMVRIKYQQFHH